MNHQQSYNLVNGTISVVLVLGILWIVFADLGNVITCPYKEAGLECISCGMTRAFQLFIGLQWEKSVEMNPTGFKMSLFTSWLLFSRIGFSMLANRKPLGAFRKLVISDIFITGTFFVIAAFPLFMYLFSDAFESH